MNSPKSITTPLYILAAAPSEPCKIKKMFESGEGSVMYLLQHPGSLRYSGWDFTGFQSPRVVKGEYVGAEGGYNEAINIYEDGTVVFRAAADHSFLGWPKNEESFPQKPLLSSIGLAEITYSFVDFYNKLFTNFTNIPKTITFRIELKNAILGSKKLYVLPHEVNNIWYQIERERFEAPSNEMCREVEVESEYMVKSVAHCAYKLFRELYLWFEVTEDRIPYVSENQAHERYIDIEKIKGKK